MPDHRGIYTRENQNDESEGAKKLMIGLIMGINGIFSLFDRISEEGSSLVIDVHDLELGMGDLKFFSGRIKMSTTWAETSQHLHDAPQDFLGEEIPIPLR